MSCLKASYVNIIVLSLRSLGSRTSSDQLVSLSTGPYLFLNSIPRLYLSLTSVPSPFVNNSGYIDLKNKLVMTRTVKIAVVGTGLAGLTAAHLLTRPLEGAFADEVEFEVHIFEKVRFDRLGL